MSTEVETIDDVEVLFTVEGQMRHFAARIDSRATVGAFAAIAAKHTGAKEIIDVYLEGAEEPLNRDLTLVEHLSANFAPLHASTRGLIATTIEYNGRCVDRDFRPSARIDKVIAWAIGPQALDLEGEPSDFQLKFKDELLPPETHLGQIVRGAKAVKLNLVFKEKPQG